MPDPRHDLQPLILPPDCWLLRLLLLACRRLWPTFAGLSRASFTLTIIDFTIIDFAITANDMAAIAELDEDFHASSASASQHMALGDIL